MAQEDKVLVILNPVAGHGRSGKLIPALQSALDRLGIGFELAVTEHAGHAREMARTSSLDGFDTVAVAGGDGTLSEVVDGLLTRFGASIPSGFKVAVVPTGTGNDFLGGSSLATDWEGAIAGLVDPKVLSVDALRVQDASGLTRYAANCFGVGFDALVTGNVNKRGSGRIGPLGYMVEAFRGLVTFNPERVGIKTAEDGFDYHPRTWLLGVTNSQQYGGGMRINPGAKIDDGVFNYAFLHGVPRISLVSLVFLARSGKHVGKDGVVLGKAAKIAVTAPDGFPCHVDGDTVHVEYPVIVEALPGALALVAPARP